MDRHKQRNSHIRWLGANSDVKFGKFAAFWGVCAGLVARLRLRASVEAKVVAHARHQGEGTFYQVKNPLKSFDDW